MADGNPTPLALDGWARSPAAPARSRPRAGPTSSSSGSCATARTATRPARPAACSATARRPMTLAGFGGTTTLVYDEQRREMVEDFVSLDGTGGQLCGRHLLSPPLLADRRGERRRGRMRPIPPRASRSVTATCSRRRSIADATSSKSACRSWPPAASRTRRRLSTSARAWSTRPRTRLGIGAGFYRYTPNEPDDLSGGGKLDMLAITGQPNVDLREGQTARRAPAGQVGASIDDARPGADQRRRRGSTFNQGWARAGRSSTASRAARRTTARSSSSPPAAATPRTATSTATATRRDSGRSGPTGPAARRRDADARVRVALRRRAGLARQPHGHAARRPDRVRGRRLLGVRRHAPARARDRERQPPDRDHAARPGVRARGQRPQRLRAGRRVLQPERPDAVLQPVRPRDVRRGPGRGR